MSDERLTVAIVDDDETVRRALRRMVSSLAYIPLEFSSGKAFLASLHDSKFGCVLLDLHMPELNGIDVLVQLRGAGYTLPAIIITGGDEPKMRARCMQAGASAYLIKPIERDDVRTAIQSLAS